MTIEEWVAYAKELGFSEAAPVVPADLKPNAEVRAMCAADKCHAYGKNWTCPPECGSLEECAARISANKALNAKRRAARSTKAAANSNK